MTESLNITDIFSHDQNFQSIMKNLLQTTFKISFDGVMITESGPGYPIIYVNPALCEMTGYTVQEFSGNSPGMLQGAKSDPKILAELKETIVRGGTFHGKTVNYRKDGEDFIMEWKIVPIRNESYGISHYLAIQREIRDDELAYHPLDSKLPFERE